MDKKKLLVQIAEFSQKGELSRHEVLEALEGSHPNKLAISTILYYVGGGIVFLGIYILIWQNWDLLGAFSRILVTFGLGVLAYIAGLFFERDDRLKNAALAFQFISLLAIPVGLHVIFDNYGFDVGTSGMQSLISFILLIFAFSSFFLSRKNVFLLFTILYGTWFFFALTNFFMADFLTQQNEAKFVQYQFLTAGLSYLMLGFSFSKTERKFITGFLYGFGILGFLGSTLFMGFEPERNLFWQLIYPGLVFGVMFLSIYLKSKVFLVFSSLFLIAYIFSLTEEYFRDSLGWPLSLMIIGLFLIGVGYLAFYLNQRYLKEG